MNVSDVVSYQQDGPMQLRMWGWPVSRA